MILTLVLMVHSPIGRPKYSIYRSMRQYHPIEDDESTHVEVEEEMSEGQGCDDDGHEDGAADNADDACA